ncbi:MAG: hypothetical protein ACTHU0_33225 [Kofleriaceae bacterium]
MDAEREQAASAIVEQARRSRRRASRGTWIASAIVGGLCAIAFVVALVSSGGAGSSGPGGSSGPSGPSAPRGSNGTSAPPARASETGLGFPTGLAIGLGVGIALGLLIARQLGDHSPRNRP